MGSSRDRAHHLGDSCPGGHRDDPFEASRLNDEQLLAELASAPAAVGRVLSDPQAALFAAVIYGVDPKWRISFRIDEVLGMADAFLGWLTDDQEQDT